MLVMVDVLNGGGVENFSLTAVDYLPILAQVPFALALRQAQVRSSAIDRAMQLTILASTILSVIQWTSYHVERPGGLNLNPIPYGLAIALWSTVLLARGLERGKSGSFSIAIAVLGTIPILLTGSKLVWACTFIGFGYVGVRWAADHGRWRLFAAGSMAALIAASAAAATVARGRLAAFIDEMAQVAHSGASQGLSVGNRLELVLSGWRAFLERPLLGYGLAERMQAARHHATPGGPDTSMNFHLHNDYMTHLVSFGVPGLVFLFLYLTLYLWLAAHTRDPAYRNSGIAVAVAVALYMCFEVAFNMDPVSGLLAVHIGILLAFPRSRETTVARLGRSLQSPTSRRCWRANP